MCQVVLDPVQAGKAVYFWLVSQLDRNPNQKCVHKRRDHDRLYLIDSESAIDSSDFYQTANGSVSCYDTISIEFLCQNRPCKKRIRPIRQTPERRWILIKKEPQRMHPTEGNVEHFPTSASRKTSGVAKKVSEFLSSWQILLENTGSSCFFCAEKKQMCEQSFVHVARTSKDFELSKSKLPEGSSRQAPMPSRAPSNSNYSIRSKRTQSWIVPKIQTMDGHERALQTSGRQRCYCLWSERAFLAVAQKDSTKMLSSGNQCYSKVTHEPR